MKPKRKSPKKRLKRTPSDFETSYPRNNVREVRLMKAAIDVHIRHHLRCRSLFEHISKEIYDAGGELFQDNFAFAVWLCAPAVALGGKVPVQVMLTADGRRQVLRLIHAIVHGVYL